MTFYPIQNNAISRSIKIATQEADVLFSKVILSRGLTTISRMVQKMLFKSQWPIRAEARPATLAIHGPLWLNRRTHTTLYYFVQRERTTEQLFVSFATLRMMTSLWYCHWILPGISRKMHPDTKVSKLSGASSYPLRCCSGEIFDKMTKSLASFRFHG